jgi:AcrR family transcriptional regulator
MNARPMRVAALAEPEHRGDRTRKAIKRVIAKLAMKRDIADINLADICAAAKLTTGAVYFHFKGKDDAIEEMVIDEVEDIYARMQKLEGANFGELVAAALDDSSAYHQRSKQLPRAIQLVINTRPKAYAVWIKAREPIIEKFCAAISSERQAAGLSTEPAPYLAHFILNSMEDLGMDLFQWNNPTLAPFATTLADWNARQTALWRHAILAPFDGD